MIKIAWLARSLRDNLEAFELLRTRRKPMIALCMGRFGLMSRVLAPKFGGFLTFASLDGSSGTAPGQISISDMKKLYRWDALSPSTKVYGVVGSPIMHSMSPAIHNAGFEAVGFDGVYLPMLVNERRQKLSKRRDKMFVSDYQDEGYLPEAFVNYVALLGWSPGSDREFLALEEMVSLFRLVVP